MSFSFVMGSFGYELCMVMAFCLKITFDLAITLLLEERNFNGFLVYHFFFLKNKKIKKFRL